VKPAGVIANDEHTGETTMLQDEACRSCAGWKLKWQKDGEKFAGAKRIGERVRRTCSLAGPRRAGRVALALLVFELGAGIQSPLSDTFGHTGDLNLG